MDVARSVSLPRCAFALPGRFFTPRLKLPNTLQSSEILTLINLLISGRSPCTEKHNALHVETICNVPGILYKDTEKAQQGIEGYYHSDEKFWIFPRQVKSGEKQWIVWRGSRPGLYMWPLEAMSAWQESPGYTVSFLSGSLTPVLCHQPFLTHIPEGHSNKACQAFVLSPENSLSQTPTLNFLSLPLWQSWLTSTKMKKVTGRTWWVCTGLGAMAQEWPQLTLKKQCQALFWTPYMFLLIQSLQQSFKVDAIRNPISQMKHWGTQRINYASKVMEVVTENWNQAVWLESKHFPTGPCCLLD